MCGYLSKATTTFASFSHLHMQVRPDALASMLLQLPNHGARSEIMMALEPNKRAGPFQQLDIDCQVKSVYVLLIRNC